MARFGQKTSADRRAVVNWSRAPTNAGQALALRAADVVTDRYFSARQGSGVSDYQVRPS